MGKICIPYAVITMAQKSLLGVVIALCTPLSSIAPTKTARSTLIGQLTRSTSDENIAHSPSHGGDRGEHVYCLPSGVAH